MKTQLTFWRLADKRPKDGANILYVSDSSNSSEIKSGEVYHIWNDGNGGSYGKKPKKNRCR
jgi:hypothetical protein